MSYNAFKQLVLCITIASVAMIGQAHAAGKTYTENDFLNTFSGKSKKVITEKLGAPAKKQLSVKPTNAGAVIGKNVEDKTSKPVKVEMWYYQNLVKYDPKRTYK